MRAFSYASEIHGTPETPMPTRLFDRARRTIEAGRVDEGIADLCGDLERIRNAMEPDAWRAFAAVAREHRTVADLVYQDPFTRRAFEKPRGYAGDAIMMDYAYDIHAAREAATQATHFGRALLRAIQNRPAVQGVRHRRTHIAQLIDQMAAAQPRPAILAIAAGHLREAELSTALSSGRIGRFVALDADAESLREVEARYSALGVETIHASVRHIIMRKVILSRFDFVYAAGLFDYLNDSTAATLTARMFELTRPGGHLLIPNFAPLCSDRGYMESFMAWDLIYRDECDMTRLLARIPPDDVASYDIYSDPSGSIVYLLIRKSRRAAVEVAAATGKGSSKP